MLAFGTEQGPSVSLISGPFDVRERAIDDPLEDGPMGGRLEMIPRCRPQTRSDDQQETFRAAFEAPSAVRRYCPGEQTPAMAQTSPRDDHGVLYARRHGQ